jgi:PAS domain S-box-containing protein
MIIAASEAYLRATATRREDILGRSIFDLFPVKLDNPGMTGVRNLRASFEKVLRERAADMITAQKYSVRRLAEEDNFEEQFWNLLNTPVLDRDGRVIYIIHRIEVVTQNVEQALRESEARFRVLADSAPVLIWVNGLEGAQFVNRAYLEFIGVGETEVQGYDWAAFVHPDDRQAYLDAYLAAFSRRSLFEAQLRLRRADGEYRWMKSAGLPRITPAGEFLGYVGSTFDITDVKQAEQALAQTHQHLQAHLTYTPLGVIEWNAEFQITRWAGEAERIFGWRAEEVMGKRRGEFRFVYEEDIASVDAVSAALARGEKVVSRNRNYDKWGKVHDCEWYNSVVIGPDGHVQSTLSLILDVTGRNLAERALAQERARLESLNETLEEQVQKRTEQVRSLTSALTLAEQRERTRISQVLHDDLQQLLYSLLMRLNILQVQLVAEGMAEPLAEISQMTQIADRATQVARTLVIELNPPVLEVEGLGEALHWLKSHMQETYGLRVHLSVQDQGYMRNRDTRALVLQMVRELLSNVINHAGADQAYVTLRQEEGALLIQIKDEGQGFDLEQVRVRHQDSSAFGLFSIQDRLALIGGRLEMDSIIGQGTQMTLIIPTR